MDPKWYYTKDDLMNNKPSSHNILLASDVKEGTGIKKFTAFPNYDTLISFLENNKKQHFYEIIPDIKNYPVFLGFDIDQEAKYIISSYENIADYTIYVEEKFRHKFEEFLANIYNTPFKLINNSNYYVSTSNSPSKLSLHIKINIKCETFLHAKNIVNTFVAYLSSNIHTTTTDKDVFFYTKQSKINCIIDTSIYTNFRSIRTLYSAKKGKNNYLTPFQDSSPHIKDHLFLFHDEYGKSTTYITLPEISNKIKHMW